MHGSRRLGYLRKGFMTHQTGEARFEAIDSVLTALSGKETAF